MSYDARLSLIQETLALLQEESMILASPEDALYFRTIAKRKSAPPTLSSKKIPEENPPLLSQTPEKIPHSQKKFNTSPIPQEPGEPEPPLTPPRPSSVLPEIHTNTNLQKGNSEEKKTTSPIKLEWRTETNLAVEPLNFSSLKSLFLKTFPQIALLDEIPSDATAKKIAGRWKTKNQIAPISILYFSEPPKQKALLIEIAKAIDICFGPARLINAETIEKEKQWETFLSSSDLKLVIACDYTLWQLNDLMHYYKEVPSQQTRTLGNIPLFLLPDLSLYLKDPLLKRSLWKAIPNAIQNLNNRR